MRHARSGRRVAAAQVCRFRIGPQRHRRGIQLRSLNDVAWSRNARDVHSHTRSLDRARKNRIRRNSHRDLSVVPTSGCRRSTCVGVHKRSGGITMRGTMKGILLGSTALLTSGLAVMPAMAADPIKINVGGYYIFYALTGAIEGTYALNGSS